ncbi:DUF4240 domain-containing protein [Tunicatimonas pelagia]|uniref:DUF4240 domain-containing protein n=1 Tax=Tunicatimonas pelagia TaxID=931531 RepID=UPI0026667A5F|nr:DUF4240 domain-containing protein [Tunicatimonas pelagia]WKN40476.1 DUF4240 domain-containing protein [Tunicatimonas pelagia]
MNNETFWQIMLETKEESDGDPTEQQELIEERLYQLSPDQIIEYDRIFGELYIGAYTWKLWAAAYVINGGCSDDCFMDFRGWLIAQGEEVYTKALADPDSLSELEKLEEDVKWEGYAYLAHSVYEEKTGKEVPERGQNHPSEPKGEEWDEDNLDELLPKLSQKYN